MYGLYVLFAAALAQAATIKVVAGSFYFEPEYILADAGDVLEFHFMPKNHSVAQGDFMNPCQPKENGFFSGYFPVDSGEASQVWRYTIQNKDPIWFYCPNPNRNHCQEGMVGVVNAPLDTTLAKYKMSAMNYNGVPGEPPMLTGGAAYPNPDLAMNQGASSNTGTASNPSIPISPNPPPMPLVPPTPTPPGGGAPLVPIGDPNAPTIPNAGALNGGTPFTEPLGSGGRIKSASPIVIAGFAAVLAVLESF